MTQGIFIAIDGPDGCGKHTQTEMLSKWLSTKGIPVETVSFPRYGTNEAKQVEAYLRGDLGPTESVPPKQASMYYAEDRKAAAPMLYDVLNAGKTLITDRYVTANMGHQGVKMQTQEERAEFFRWVEHLEFTENAIPRPNLTIILVAPASICLANIDTRGKAKDGHEQLDHLIAAERTFRELANAMPGCVLIECAENGAMLERAKIHERIVALVEPMYHI